MIDHTLIPLIIAMLFVIALLWVMSRGLQVEFGQMVVLLPVASLAVLIIGLFVAGLIVIGGTPR